MNEITTKVRLQYYILSIILVLYIFRDIFAKFGLENLVLIFYALFILTVIPTCRRLLFRRDIFLFIAICFIATAFTLVRYDMPITSLCVGLFTLVFNLIIWMIFIQNLDHKSYKIVLQKYLHLIIVLGVITSILGIYQYFGDASLWGCVSNEIYGNIELMNSGIIVRRSTAFLGSSQNYGFFLGAVFAIVINMESKIAKKICIVGILSVGILVSGTRSAMLGVLVALIVKIVQTIKEGKISKRMMVLIPVSFLFTSILLIFASNRIYDTTVNRMFVFKLSETAKNAYKSGLSSFDIINILFGKGVGYKNWTVASFLGESKYSTIFKESYRSVESMLLTVYLQTGLLGLVEFFTLILKSLASALRNKSMLFAACLCMALNIIFTPSFSGLSMNFFGWSLFLLGLLYKEEEVIKWCASERT